ncbi:hypothetical protein HYPSUDRAFT_49329 [Hypholoma sublateritium FD-334 SS-4]|uniref:Uncharacterized protein n=1 Tax=Hypholoma sublateritium (strain FD-334 SS-4) TaxID=945553 RepID=A0A0D2NCH5_HYPSF|nr:hypothetical protein HYPSUDRAFT_49329 [Hypholoma sublateritium FD-334 SS-4]
MSVLATQNQTSSSRSPTRRSLGDKISALGARLSRTLSHAEESREEDDQYSIGSPPSYYKNERSTSRGRDAFQSTGRGGIGNIRQASLSRDARPDSGPDDFSATRGREPHPARAPAAVFSTGRGGAGNLRSPSRDPAPAAGDAAEQDVIREYTAAHEGAPVSSGRGGIGNITHSRSRSRPPPAVHSTGRGGAGNIVPGDGLRPEVIDAEERRHVAPHEGPHSTGRGGQANISTLHEPPVEHHEHAHAHFESTGRGGAGNIHSERARSKSKSRA